MLNEAINQSILKEKEKNRVAVYIRVSTDQQNLDRQKTMCMNYCDRLDLPVYKVYEDVYSGATDKRPAFNEMLEEMRQYKFKTVIVTKLDRIGRSLKHLLSLFDELASKRVGFIAITQNIDTTSSMGRLQLQILGAFAEFERNLISERTKEGLKHKKNVGKRGKDKKKRSNAGYFKKNKGGYKKP